MTALHEKIIDHARKLNDCGTGKILEHAGKWNDQTVGKLDVFETSHTRKK